MSLMNIRDEVGGTDLWEKESIFIPVFINKIVSSFSKLKKNWVPQEVVGKFFHQSFILRRLISAVHESYLQAHVWENQTENLFSLNSLNFLWLNYQHLQSRKPLGPSSIFSCRTFPCEWFKILRPSSNALWIRLRGTWDIHPQNSSECLVKLRSEKLNC